MAPSNPANTIAPLVANDLPVIHHRRFKTKAPQNQSAQNSWMKVGYDNVWG